ncbi:hypothetical protein ACF07B_07055 [Streptomyces sp. NPDC015532]|uniref:hypothetical protein n=1 Tax=Streptomyces sp. NPDC015532 TaxID=3364960 RepID=UPI0036FAEBE4
MSCDGPVNPCLGNLYRGQGACSPRACKITGFKDSEPALVYLLQRTTGPAMAKIGICEDSVRNTRLQLHVRNGWEVLYTRPFRVGLHARLVEGAIKTVVVRRTRLAERGARGERRSDGYTETVLLKDDERSDPWSVVTALALWMDVLAEVERLGFDLDQQRLEVGADGSLAAEDAGFPSLQS